jgi:phospholipid/cholesterol/gamma-HCH transport system permease protein
MVTAGFTLDTSDAGDRRHLVLAGQVTLADGEALWRTLRRALRGTRTVEIDVGGVTRLDGGAAALLSAAKAELERAGGACTFANGSAETAQLLQLYDPARTAGAGVQSGKPKRYGTLADVGDWTWRTWRDTQATLAFLGDLVFGLVQAVRRPRTVHYGELGLLVERAGTDGLPIVVLINFLVGAILGLQGALQLHRFGADQFLANLVGLSVVRELGPLMTAILVTGRSGAAYAAELGTMTVNEEIDALRTIGQDPQRFLVFPRVLTLLIVLPVLTLVADVVGCLGGLAIAVVHLEQPVVVYLSALQRAVHLDDLGTGLLKSLWFALAIGLISCQRGLATRGGADGVGRATTSAVVVVLFALVALDAVFTWLFSLLGW